MALTLLPQSQAAPPRTDPAGSGDKDEHEQRAALHRAAQARDTQRAVRVESLVPDGHAHEQDGKDLDRQRSAAAVGKQ